MSVLPEARGFDTEVPPRIGLHWAVCLPWEEARFSVHEEVFHEELAGEELEIEPHPVCPFGRQRPVQIHHDSYAVPLRCAVIEYSEREIR